MTGVALGDLLQLGILICSIISLVLKIVSYDKKEIAALLANRSAIYLA